MPPAHTYRRDIDGLRSLAILPVLAFHSHVPGFAGGYVGVDIFFVISGYLITGIIVREIDRGEFSIVRFYERRARRILPALFAMLAFVLAVSAWLYLPSDFQTVAPSVLMSLAFLANVWFFLNTGYFQGGAETKPLLHCWSLGVEEQFYIGFPVMLWLIARYAPRWRNAAIAAIAAGSLLLAWWTEAAGDGFAFYLLPPRAWELFAGALLAVGAIPGVRNPAIGSGLAATGLALIIAPVILYDSHTVFPGLTAIPPVLGAVLLLHTAPGTPVGRALSSAALVGIGLISYSLYLWHWPLIVFAEYALGEPLAGWRQLAVIAATMVIAVASWRYIERPFRDGTRFGRKRIFVFSGLGMAVLGALAAALLPLGGWDARFSPQVLRLAAGAGDISPKRAACLNDAVGGERPECNLGAPVPPVALLWGDSHGVELSWALGQELGAKGEALMQRTHASCPPAIGYTVSADPGCARFNAEVLARAIATPEIRTVYLAGFWANGTYRDAGTLALLDRTIASLQAAGKHVTVIGPVPSQAWDVPRHLAQGAARGGPSSEAGNSLVHYREEAGWFTRNYPRWRAQGVTILDPAVALMAGGHSRIAKDGVPLYFDSHHLSLAGARAVLAADLRR